MVLATDKTKNITVAVRTLSGENVYLILRHPTYEEKDAYRRVAMKMIDGQAEPDFDEAAKFVDSLLVGCKNVHVRSVENADEVVPLDPEKHPAWKGCIDRDWKIQCSAIFALPVGRIVGGSESGPF